MKEFEQYREMMLAQLESSKEEKSRQVLAHREKIEALAAEIALEDVALIRAQQALPEGQVCPRCWVWDGRVIELKCVPSDSDTDILKCPTCKEYFPINAEA